jgi:hypothetical protein
MASTYLRRTSFGTPTLATKFTISFWFKRTGLGSKYLMGCYDGSSTNANDFVFTSGDALAMYFGGNAGSGYLLQPNRVFRDTNAWYHLVYEVDTTQATDSNRVKIYINGEQETSFSTTQYPPQNATTFIFNSVNNNIGQNWNATSNAFDGSITHFHFIDGTAYDASAFGETDATTGIWKPKTAPSVSYGTNGFFLKFENSGAFGTDSSGNGNNFTVNGTMTQTIDTPSNVFCTMNALSKSSYLTLSNGNLTTFGNTSADGGNVFGTLAVSKGKYYWEAKASVVSFFPWIGVANVASTQVNRLLNGGAGAAGYSNNEFSYRANGQVYINDVTAATYTTFSTNDIVGIALDCDNKAAYVSINGTFVNSGDPTSGASKTGAVCTWSDEQTMMPSVLDYNGTNTYFNFGNGYFGTTAVSSAQNPDDGIGIFEYDVPAGYRALCTKSINAEEYS